MVPQDKWNLLIVGVDASDHDIMLQFIFHTTFWGHFYDVMKAIKMTESFLVSEYLPWNYRLKTVVNDDCQLLEESPLKQLRACLCWSDLKTSSWWHIVPNYLMGYRLGYRCTMYRGNIFHLQLFLPDTFIRGIELYYRIKLQKNVKVKERIFLESFVCASQKYAVMKWMLYSANDDGHLIEILVSI